VCDGKDFGEEAAVNEEQRDYTDSKTVEHFYIIFKV
jgi:hypothetical protein